MLVLWRKSVKQDIGVGPDEGFDESAQTTAVGKVPIRQDLLSQERDKAGKLESLGGTSVDRFLSGTDERRRGSGRFLTAS